MHFVTRYGHASSHHFCKRQSAVFALTGYTMLCSAKPTHAMMLQVFLGNHVCLVMSGHAWYPVTLKCVADCVLILVTGVLKTQHF